MTRPQVATYWWPSGPILVMLVVATLWLLARAGIRSPAERPRILGLTAILVSMLSVSLVVAISRTGLGSSVILSSRYITLAMPLLCVMFVVRLAYGEFPHGRSSIWA